MNSLNEGKELSQHVSYDLNDSAGAQRVVHQETTRQVFQTINYKNKTVDNDNIEKFFGNSRADGSRLSHDLPGREHEDTRISDGKAVPQPEPFDIWFYAAYLGGFFLSVFAVAAMFAFSKRELYQRGSVYGATASMFFVNLIGLYYLTSIVQELDKRVNGPPSRSLGLAGGEPLQSLSGVIEKVLGRIV